MQGSPAGQPLLGRLPDRRRRVHPRRRARSSTSSSGSGVRAHERRCRPRLTATICLELRLDTAIPVRRRVAMFLVSMCVLNNVQARSDDPGVTVDVTAFQWQWKFEYRDAGVQVNGQISRIHAWRRAVPARMGRRWSCPWTRRSWSACTRRTSSTRSTCPPSSRRWTWSRVGRMSSNSDRASPARTAANAPSSVASPTLTCTSRSER